MAARMLTVCALLLVLVDRGMTSNVINEKPTSCPRMCQCDGLLTKINCAKTNLDKVPDYLPKTVTHLNLQSNNIGELTNLAGLDNLVHLDLSDNNISFIDESAFTGLAELHVLSLANNNLSADSLPCLAPLTVLSTLDLSHNAFTAWPARASARAFPCLSSLTHLNLSYNSLTEIPQGAFTGACQLQSFNQTHHQGSLLVGANEETQRQGSLLVEDSEQAHHQGSLLVGANDETLHQGSLVLGANEQTYHQESLMAGTNETQEVESSLEVLDLSHNHIHALHRGSLAHMLNLTHLYLQNNKLESIEAATFTGLTNLVFANFSQNPTYKIPAFLLANCSNLLNLDLSHMTQLSILDHQAFLGLGSLRQLNLGHNRQLGNIHAGTFAQLNQLETLDLSNDDFETIYHPTFQNLTKLKTLYLHGNPWSCDCELRWLHQWVTGNISSPLAKTIQEITCAKPVNLEGLSLSKVAAQNLTCHGAYIVNVTQVAAFRIGSAGILDCVTSGSPRPVVTWLTPRGLRLRYNPAFFPWGALGPHHPDFHAYHPWHLSDDYFVEIPRHQRLHILQNGSLYIDYLQRGDAGPYVCIAHNRLNNDSAVVALRLQIPMVTVTSWSILFGFVAGMVFFAICMLVALIRHLVLKCSPVAKAKRDSIRQLLENLNAYRATQIGRLSEYKTAKFDQLSAFKSAKFDNLRNYKNLTLTTLVQYMKGLREHYSTSVAGVKDSCRQQADRLKDNYTTQLGKFKDYRSYQIDKLRENYHGQMVKLREYGSSQVEKLREQYKFQQNHVLKLVEILDIGNCMNVIEAECMRTESMIFDPDLDIDFDTHPVHLPIRLTESDNDSEYETATSQKQAPVRKRRRGRKKEKRKKPPPSEEGDETPVPLNDDCPSSAQDLPHPSAARPRRPHYLYRRRHKNKHHPHEQNPNTHSSPVDIQVHTKNKSSVCDSRETTPSEDFSPGVHYPRPREVDHEPSPGVESLYVTSPENDTEESTGYESAIQTGVTVAHNVKPDQCYPPSVSYQSTPSTSSTPTLTMDCSITQLSQSASSGDQTTGGARNQSASPIDGKDLSVSQSGSPSDNKDLSISQSDNKDLSISQSEDHVIIMNPDTGSKHDDTSVDLESVV